MATIEIRITRDNGEVEQGVFYQAKKDLAKYWLDNSLVSRIEVRVLSEQSNTPKDEWDLDATGEIVEENKKK